MIAEIIYLLCGATSLFAAALLFRQNRARSAPLLIWSSVGFAGLAISNVMVYVDLSLLPNVNLAMPRSAVGTASMVALLYGLIRDSAR